MHSTSASEISEHLKQPYAGGKPPSSKQGVPWHWILLAAMMIGGGYWFFSPAKPPESKPGMGRGMRGGTGVVPVVAATVKQKDVPIFLEGLGTVQAFNSVTIRSRVDGQLTQVAFTEGQNVKAGEVLAKIDPAPYKATLDQALARKQQNEALLATARLDLARFQEMFERKAASQQQYDTQKNLVAQFVATVAADDATIESAQVQLDYTTLTSPLEGRAGIRQVDQGNIIRASDPNGLVTITQLRPISLVFTLPERNLPEIRKQMEKGALEVLAVDRDNGPVIAHGTVDLFDNQIDPATGTIKLKATFANDNLALWPGQFINARLLLSTRKDGIVVPAAVIQRGPNGTFAFVIQKKDDDLVVEVRPVTVAQIEAGQALVDEGLTPGEQVVLEGQYRLQADAKVRIQEPAAQGRGDKPQNNP